MKKLLYKLQKYFFLVPLAFVPQFSSAAGYCSGVDISKLSSSSQSVSGVFKFVSCLISGALIPFMFILATLLFIWGVVKFIGGAHDSTEREEGRTFMIYGVVALAVMVGVWGLVFILTNTFGVGNVVPQIPSVT